jgi:hypothetical protein
VDGSQVKIPPIGFKMGSINDFNSILPAHELSYGSIIKVKSNDYTLNLIIEPQNDDLLYNFNYHHQINEQPIEKIIKNLDNFSNLYNLSNNIIQKNIKGIK